MAEQFSKCIEENSTNKPRNSRRTKIIWRILLGNDWAGSETSYKPQLSHASLLRNEQCSSPNSLAKSRWLVGQIKGLFLTSLHASWITRLILYPTSLDYMLLKHFDVFMTLHQSIRLSNFQLCRFLVATGKWTTHKKTTNRIQNEFTYCDLRPSPHNGKYPRSHMDVEIFTSRENGMHTRNKM